MRFHFTTIFMLIGCLSGFSQTPDEVLQKALPSELKDLSKNIRLSRQLNNTSLQVTHYYFQQFHHDIPVYNAVGDAHVDAKGNLVSFHHNFVKPQSLPEVTNPVISADEAFHATAEELEFGYDSHFGQALFSQEGSKWVCRDPGLSDEPIKAALTLFNHQGEWRLHYEIEWHFPSGSQVYAAYVDAFSGKLSHLLDQALHCDFDHDHQSHEPVSMPKIQESAATAKTSSTPTYRVLEIPAESPNHGPFRLVSDPSDSLSSPFGWHDVDGIEGAEFTITRGNNVLAREDKDANNTGGYSPDGGSSLVFDFEFRNERRDALYDDAAITNLFYMNNIMHDVWYHYGFDEESGNFQQNNYGRGGNEARANDIVIAEARDGSGTNNANFFTPDDGQNGRMQMFLWTNNSASDLLHVSSPPAAAGSYSAARAGFGPQLSTVPFTANLVLADDGTANPQSACSAIQNATEMNGKIAVIERGGCTFVSKVLNAQDAGAIAVIIVNNQAGAPITMGGSSSAITIPSVHISREDGAQITDAMSKGVVNASLYDSSAVNTDIFGSDFDNGIIAHEYGHGISNRLTGGPMNSACLRNEEQAGEGWSDFFTLVMTHQPEDEANDPRGIGTYVRNQSTNGRGIRPFPYSRSLNVNPVTYENIKTFSVPHGVGSVWCSMLWDLYWNMIDEHGYDPDIYKGTGGNNMAMQLVMDGMKLQSCNPGFIDSRDAILLADRLRYQGQNQKMIWETFARRGLGYSAQQGSSDDRSDGVQAFDIPEWLENQIFVDKTAPERVPAGTFYEYRITGRNLTRETQYDIVLTDTLDPALTVEEASLTEGAVFENGIVQLRADSLTAGDSLILRFNAAVMNPDTYTELSFFDDMEADSSSWQILSENGANVWERVQTMTYSGENSWFVRNVGVQSDQSLYGTFEIRGERPALVFRHLYNTEDGWDGGVVEVRVAGSSTWNDVSQLFLLGGYNQQIQTNPASNISDRMAFSGNSGGWVKSVVDLALYKDREIDIRFRFVSDAAADGVGWFIDDVEIADLFAISNVAYSSGRDLNMKESNEVFTIIDLNEALNVNGATLEGKVSVFPNPFTQRLTISTTENDLTYEFCDMMGKTLQSESLNKGLNDLRVNSTISAGTYMLRIQGEKAQQVIKLIKW